MRRVALPSLLVCALLAAGCGKPRLYPVTGQVKIDGKPAGAVRVYFWPEGASTRKTGTNIGVGFSESDGRFKITSGSGEEGLERGDYRVTFTRMAVKGQILNPTERRDDAVDIVPKPHSDHENPQNSPVTAKVQGDTDVAFDVPVKK